MTRVHKLAAIWLLALCPAAAFCQDAVLTNSSVSIGGDGGILAPGQIQMTEARQLSDLTLLNFFSAGWDEDFSRRVRDTGTPDYALLRVQTNFMEREFRVNYFYDQAIHSKTREHLTNMDAFIAYGFNRRFMIEVLDNYQWAGARGKTADTDGGDPQIIGRVQLVDTDPSSYSFNFKIIAPDRGIGQTQTTFNYGFAGFNDLAYWLNLSKTGLYYSVSFDSLTGPHAVGALKDDVSYDISLAHTLLPMDTPWLGGFTTFLEAFGQTNLDGAAAGATVVTLTPGIRFNLGTTGLMKFGLDNSILFGVDIPVSGPRPYDVGYRLTYIKNF
jgi:hypothetical protein